MLIRLIKYNKRASKKQLDRYGKMTTPIYECRVWVDDEKKIIIKIDCDCWNFQNKRIKKVGRVQDIKFVGFPCKHLLSVVNAFKLQGYKFKEINKGIGEDKCTTKLKKQLFELYKGECSVNDCHETENLEIHRSIPGVNGGKYSLMNCVPLCNDHHKLITFQRYRDLK